VKGNAKKPEDIFEKRELEKDRIKALKISSCKYDLEKFFEKFDQAVVSVLSV
jgi:hypothetical protein